MKITRSFEYSASPEAVFTMMADPDFQTRKVEATNPVSSSASVTPKGDQTEIFTRRVLATDSFPDFVRSMVGPKLAVTETIVWSPASVDGSRTGTIRIAVGEAPIGMEGTVRMAPTGNGSTRVDVNGDLKAKIPLVGSRIEKAAAGPIVSAIDQEHETGEEWLAG